MLHQADTTMPCLTDLFSNGIVSILYLIKRKSMEFSDIDLSGIVQNFIIGNYIHNLPKYAQTTRLRLHLHNFTLQCKRVFSNNRSVYPFTFDGVKSGTLKFVCHLVGTADSKKTHSLSVSVPGTAKANAFPA